MSVQSACPASYATGTLSSRGGSSRRSRHSSCRSLRSSTYVRKTASGDPYSIPIDDLRPKQHKQQPDLPSRAATQGRPSIPLAVTQAVSTTIPGQTGTSIVTQTQSEEEPVERKISPQRYRTWTVKRTCRVCKPPVTFRGMEPYDRHEMMYHSKDLHHQLICEICGRLYKERRWLNKHLRTFHFVHECEVDHCGQLFCNRQLLVDHCRDEHDMEIDGGAAKKEKEDEEESDVGAKQERITMPVEEEMELDDDKLMLGLLGKRTEKLLETSSTARERESVELEKRPSDASHWAFRSLIAGRGQQLSTPQPSTGSPKGSRSRVVKREKYEDADDDIVMAAGPGIKREDESALASDSEASSKRRTRIKINRTRRRRKHSEI